MKKKKQFHAKKVFWNSHLIALVGVKKKNVIDWLGLKNNHVSDQRSELRPVVISGTNSGK